MSIDYENIKKLVALVEGKGLSELTVEEDDLTVTIKAEQESERVSVIVPGGEDFRMSSIPQETFAQAEEEAEEAAAPTAAENPNIVEIKSPMIGIYFRYPSPDSPPFVEVGDRVEAGQTIGLIEAMKVFSEIPSEISGKVIEIPATNGKLVQQGEVILVLDTTP